MKRLIIPLIGVVLFLLEPEFALFSPIELGEQTLYLVPRFVILYLIFLAIYYDQKRAIQYGFIFGLIYDIYYVNIVGLYTVLYPLVCFLAGKVIRAVADNLFTTTLLSVFLTGLLEFALYEFYYVIHLTTMGLQPFIFTRLIPTVIMNLLFIMMLGWFFKYAMNSRLLQKTRGNL